MERKLEIYGTLGPSCADTKILRRMFEKGITGMRLNLSHGTLEDSGEMISAFHEAAALEGVKPSLLIDMQGPELRIGKIPAGTSLREGQEVTLLSADAGREREGAIPVPPEITGNCEEGMTLLIDDGKIRLEAFEIGSKEGEGAIRARVLTGGSLLSRKSIAISGMNVTGSTLTGQDLLNLRAAAAYGVTDVMQPFVRGARDLREVRKAMDESGAGHCRLFAKIENRAGMEMVDEILPLTDMLVIARGDLGNAVPLWELPYVQKEISLKCLKAGVPFMVVTQMLASMENSPLPTRAEVSDIFNAVADGASAVMITGESASGRYPVEASEYLVKTAREGLRWRKTV
ncbi:MAG TPA: pyruvate kinase [Lachnospiraceae bacterium]|nr:pyruvate kinase [Lachnospiraceae bacterium]